MEDLIVYQKVAEENGETFFLEIFATKEECEKCIAHHMLADAGCRIKMGCEDMEEISYYIKEHVILKAYDPTRINGWLAEPKLPY